MIIAVRLIATRSKRLIMRTSALSASIAPTQLMTKPERRLTQKWEISLRAFIQNGWDKPEKKLTPEISQCYINDEGVRVTVLSPEPNQEAVGFSGGLGDIVEEISNGALVG